ncbi:midasin-like isoform X3 [Quercus suber]|uniref:midasin-like isoform X3 n=1 Tax=Quercus suber TaxID=58331 RepID=UPI0032E00EDC
MFSCLQSLAEKDGSVLEKITAHQNFFVLATMNPGGDYGKKELSPALRNRFTEIWVPPVGDLNELKSIVLQRFSNPNQSHIVDAMLSFWEVETNNLIYTKLSRMENFGWGDLGMTADISCTENMQCDNIFGINPFYIEKDRALSNQSHQIQQS